MHQLILHETHTVKYICLAHLNVVLQIEKANSFKFDVSLFSLQYLIFFENRLQNPQNLLSYLCLWVRKTIYLLITLYNKFKIEIVLTCVFLYCFTLHIVLFINRSRKKKKE